LKAEILAISFTLLGSWFPLKAEILAISFTLLGSWFHSLGAAEKNARSQKNSGKFKHFNLNYNIEEVALRVDGHNIHLVL
jgi:hypothetical protein